MTQELKKIKIFKNLSSEELSLVKKISQAVDYPMGQEIFAENTISPGLFIVLSGAVKIVKKVTNSTVDETLTLINAGSFFGEASFMDGRAHSATTLAIKDTKLLIIKKEDFDRLAAENPHLACQITREIVSEIIEVLRSMDEKFIEMMKFIWDRAR